MFLNVLLGVSGHNCGDAENVGWVNEFRPNAVAQGPVMFFDDFSIQLDWDIHELNRR